MKTLIQMASVLLFLFSMEQAFAKADLNKKNQAKLGTSFRFDGSSLHGKYQTSPSTTAIVEDDKFMEDLLGARKHFNDRIQKDQSRN
ncbi:MAG: hypothetical protein ACAH59_11435 [Pseudobdellovibrionaceae bacterium]